MSLFRDFIYYDDRTIDSYLSAIEGGLYDAEDRRTRVDSSGVTPEGDQISPELLSSSDSRSRTMRQTPAARFDRLVNYIQSSEGVKTVRSSEVSYSDFSDDDEAFYQIKGSVEISLIVSAVMNADKLHAFGNAMREFSRLGLTQMTNDQAVDQLGALSEAREALGDKVSVVLGAEGMGVRFVLPLRADLVEERFNELEGRVTVFGRVAELIPKSESYTLIDVPGRPALSRQQRRQAERSGKEDAAVVKGPLVVLHVLAVYR